MVYKGKFFDSFEEIEDLREEGKVLHKLLDVMFIVSTAVICGCNEWKEVHLWATRKTNIEWLKKYIELPNGIPSLSTIGRLFNYVCPKQFEKCFIQWMRSVVDLQGRDIVSIDGKTSCGSKDGDKKGLHIVSALCDAGGLILGQIKTEDKSNEITAIPELLDMLYLEGCIITIDAMGCQRKIAKKIVKDAKADYVLNLKANQESLLNEVEEYFKDLEESGVIERLNQQMKYTHKQESFENELLQAIKTTEKGHGRIEKRTYYLSTDIQWMKNAKKDWTGLAGVGMVLREIQKNEHKSLETAFFITSVTKVSEFSTAVRSHWGVESMHWCLDVTFKDDANRTRKDKAPNNMAILKRLAFNVVKKDTTQYPKESMKSKRFIAHSDHEYRDYLLNLNFK